MKLTKVHVHEFKSIMDSNQFDVTDITCLVGKNEAGKTAILEALYKLNPIIPEHAQFDLTEDYPRAHLEDYVADVEQNKRDPAEVVEAYFSLDADEVAAIEKEFGTGCLRGASHQLRLAKGYDNKLSVTVDYDEPQIVKNLISAVRFANEESRVHVEQAGNLKSLQLILMNDSNTAMQYEGDALSGQENAPTPNAEPPVPNMAAKLLLEKLGEYIDKGLHAYIFQTYLESKLPKFLYFDEFYQMEGQVNIEALKERLANNQLLDSDRPMLALMELARINMDQLAGVENNTHSLVSRIEGAGNYLSRRILEYWSQNRHIQLRFDARPGRPGDPPGYQSGTNLWVNVYDSAHWVTVRLGMRSRGFIWFFSFLAWFFQQLKSGKPMILLLDEPGVFLHASAQEDLLRFIEKELENHQVIYTTHSPFMIVPRHLERVRVVCDRGMDQDKTLPQEEEGTKVFSDPLQADSGSLSPLQGTLAFHTMQNLLMGPHTLIVEGVSDMFYIQGMTDLLERAEKTGLSDVWTLTPVGGIDKIPTFAALFGAQKQLNLALLIDYQKKDQPAIDNMYKQNLLKQSRVFTFADFTGTAEADIEDMFDPEFYLELVNGEYKDELPKRIYQGDLPQHPRIVARLEQYFQRNPIKNNVRFNPYRPARYFAEHASELSTKMSAKTQERFEAAFKAVNKLVQSATEKTAAD
jgi:predicted ATPase